MIKEALDAYVSATAKVWKHDRTKTIGASEIGQCSRRVWYVKNKQPQDVDYADDWGARVRGTVFEDSFWAPAMKRRFGKDLLYSGKSQKTFQDGHLSATPDGLITGLKNDALKHLGVPDIGSDSILAECKTVDPRVDLTVAKAHNVYQTQVQLHLVRKLTKFKPNYSLLNYASASFWSEITEFAVKYDPAVAAAAEQRATAIIMGKAATDFQPEGWVAGGKECTHCPFLKPCGIERRNLPFQDLPIDPQFKAEMTDMVREAKAIEASIEDNESALRIQQQAIKDRLREKGIKKIPGVVTWSNVKGSQRYDNKAVQAAAIAAGVDIEKFKTEGEPTDRLTLAEIPATV